VRVVEVSRLSRQNRRNRGRKSDLIDAEAAARVVLAGEATAKPRGGDDTSLDPNKDYQPRHTATQIGHDVVRQTGTMS